MSATSKSITKSSKPRKRRSRVKTKKDNENENMYYAEYELPEPFITRFGILYYIHQRIFKFEHDLDFLILFINKFVVVDDQSQIHCDIITNNGVLTNHRVLLDDVPIWMWIDAAIGIEHKLVKMKFVQNMKFFKKLLLKNYNGYWKVGDIMHHQYYIGTHRTKQHDPARSQILSVYPQKYAPQIYANEYELKLLTYGRKHKGVKIGGGKVCDMSLMEFGKGEVIERWDDDIAAALLNASRKSSEFGCQYFVDKYCEDLKEIYLDLNIESAFYRKPQKFELFKNCNVYGFDGIFAKDLLRTLLNKVFRLRVLRKKKKKMNFGQTESISGNYENLMKYGEYINEYLMEYGMKLYLINELNLNLECDIKYITILLNLDIMDNEFDLKIIKTNADRSKYMLESPVIIKYARKESRLFVWKFKWSLKNNRVLQIDESDEESNDMIDGNDIEMMNDEN